MKISFATCAIALSAIIGTANSAVAQYRHSPVRPALDESQILAQGTAVQVPLGVIADAKQTVAKASVQDKDGHAVGSVNSVVTDRSGRPDFVKVKIDGTLGVGGKVISLDARALLFEQDRDVLIAPLTRDEIKALPASGT
jgi:hypothetical protein